MASQAAVAWSGTIVRISERPQKKDIFIASSATCLGSARSAAYEASASQPTCTSVVPGVPASAMRLGAVSGSSSLGGVVSRRMAAISLKGAVGP